MAKLKTITDRMELAEAIEISRTYPLETLINNVLKPGKNVGKYRSAELVLAERLDPQVMPRLLELMKQDLKSADGSRWLCVINERLRNRVLPSSEAQLAIAALLPLVDSGKWPADRDAIHALSNVDPLPTEVVEHCARYLDSSKEWLAGAAIDLLLSLPTEAQSRWVPALLKRLKQDGLDRSESNNILKVLPRHFRTHREQILPALRAGLKSEDTSIPETVLKGLNELGPEAAAMIPDVLKYIGRLSAYIFDEPVLAHLEPDGMTAIPGLVKLLGSKNECVMHRAISELEAYGDRATAAVPRLTEIAESKNPDWDWLIPDAQRVLAAITGTTAPNQPELPAWLQRIAKKNPKPKK